MNKWWIWSGEDDSHLFPQLHFLPICCRCEPAFLQAACSDIQRQLPVDLGIFQSTAAMLPVPLPTSYLDQASFGSAAWLRGWSCSLVPKPGLSLQPWASLHSGPFGLRQEQPSPVQHWGGGGWGAVLGSAGGMEGEGGTRRNGVVRT